MLEISGPLAKNFFDEIISVSLVKGILAFRPFFAVSEIGPRLSIKTVYANTLQSTKDLFYC